MSETSAAYGLTAMRITLGTIVGAHGLADTFGAFGGLGLRGFAGWMADHVAVLPDLLAWLVAIGELVFGAMLLVGTFARPAAGLTALVALGSIWLLGTWRRLLGAGGCEHALALAAMGLCLMLAGPGRLAWNVQIKKSH